MEKDRVATKQGVGCSNHPGRTKPLQVNELACESSEPKLVDSSRESRPVKMKIVLIQKHSSGTEHLPINQGISIRLNFNRLAGKNLAPRRVGRSAET